MSRGRRGAVGRTWRVCGLGAAVLVSACRQTGEVVLPTAEEIAERYAYEGYLEAELSGNVAVVTVTQPAAQLRRGGTLWAKVGPYVVLFSEPTRALLEQYPGLAGVRVVTRVAGGPEVARALLRRGELSGVLWRRSFNIAGLARRDGTERP
ncbi:MAG TPA: hypothetical protein VK849_07235, partial [Longimicrobiales bacterium]|nr:hypothetical protein [Longimicrobiales bacterium]